MSAAYTAWGQRNYVWPIQPVNDWEDCFGYNARWGYQKDLSGFYYCQNRYYDPANGRWLTRDPIGFGGGVNLYGYCGGGPVGAVDPWGLLVWSLQKWLITGDGYSDDLSYESGLAQAWHSLENWEGHFADRNRSAAAWLVLGTTGTTVPFWKSSKRTSEMLPGCRESSSVARRAANALGRRLGRAGRPGSRLFEVAEGVADGVKARFKTSGKIRGPLGPALVSYSRG